MAARRGKTQARRNSSSQGTPGWVWLVAGVAIAAVVFLAAPNLFKGEGDGFLRAGPQPNPNAQPAPVADADSDVGSQPAAQPATPKPAEPEKPAATQYDFYTLLPGKEVEMSDAELAASARAEDQRRAKAEASRAQAALEGKPVPPASTATPAPTATASVASTAPVTASNRPLPAPLSERPAAATPPASTAPASTSTAATPALPLPRSILFLHQFWTSLSSVGVQVPLDHSHRRIGICRGLPQEGDRGCGIFVHSGDKIFPKGLPSLVSGGPNHRSPSS